MSCQAGAVSGAARWLPDDWLAGRVGCQGQRVPGTGAGGPTARNRITATGQDQTFYRDQQARGPCQHSGPCLGQWGGPEGPPRTTVTGPGARAEPLVRSVTVGLMT